MMRLPALLIRQVIPYRVRIKTRIKKRIPNVICIASAIALLHPSFCSKSSQSEFSTTVFLAEGLKIGKLLQGSSGIMDSRQTTVSTMQSKAIFLFALLLGIPILGPNLCFSEQALHKSLTILFGDSLNGSIEPCPGCEGGSQLGGLARRGSWVQSAREPRNESLLLDAGDLFFDRYRKEIPPEDVAAQSEKVRLILRCYNLLGYDALGIGDDDLTLGKDFLVDLSKAASFPFVSSNLMDRETGEALFQTHVVKETGGLRIGIFSLLSPYLFSTESDSRITGIAVREPFEEARSILKKIRPETDLVVLLSHLGYAPDIELAETVPGIDVIFGGHSGLSLSYLMRIKETIIVRGGSKGLHVGELHLSLAPNRSASPGPTLKNPIPLSSSIKEHHEIAEMVKAYKMKHSQEWFKADEMCPEL
jgi:2',3'-cyclic-nucleotide 2'-phosphodiesterase (5'-nucleotidase family)